MSTTPEKCHSGRENKRQDIESQLFVRFPPSGCSGCCIPEEVTPADIAPDDMFLSTVDLSCSPGSEIDFDYCPEIGVTNPLVSGYRLMK